MIKKECWNESLTEIIKGITATIRKYHFTRQTDQQKKKKKCPKSRASQRESDKYRIIEQETDKQMQESQQSSRVTPKDKLMYDKCCKWPVHNGGFLFPFFLLCR